MAPSPVDKQPAGYKSPHDWLVSLAMDLATLCDMWRWKWHQQMPFGCFSEDLAFAHHFVATRPPLTLPPCRSASGIDYPSKTLSKMVSYSASYPFYSWCLDRA